MPVKKIFILVALVLLLAGGGAATWLFVLQPKDASADEAAEELVEVPPEPVFVDFQPVRLPLIRSGRVTQHITLVFTLEVPDEEMADQVIQISPLLHDAYMSALYGELHYEDLVDGGVVRLDTVRQTVQQASIEILGRDAVRQVLIQAVDQQVF